MRKLKTVVVGSKTGKNPSTGRRGRRSTPAAVIERDSVGVITMTMRGKSGAVTVLRSRRSGRFTTQKSAHVLDKGAERFAGPLQRLAKK